MEINLTAVTCSRESLISAMNYKYANYYILIIPCSGKILLRAANSSARFDSPLHYEAERVKLQFR
jgi:hypothetical protein